jgi:hypothetical protein
VIGLLKGINKRQYEKYIIISAHYDHLGIGPPVKGDSIYNGVVDTVPPESSESEPSEFNLNSKWGLPDSNTGRRSAAMLEAMKMGPNSATLSVQSTSSGKQFNIHLDLEEDDPYRIVGLNVEINE